MTWRGTALENAVASSQRLAPRTQQLYLKRVQEFVRFAGQYPHQWTAANVEAWRDHLLKKGLKPQTVNLYLSAVRFASKRADELGLAANFARGAESARKEVTTEAPRVLSQSEVKRLLATCKDTPPDLRDRAMILVGIGCAFRRAELCGITFKDVRGRRIHVIAKGQRMHVVACPAQAMEVLQAWMAWLRDHGVNKGPVFRSMRASVEEHGWTIGTGMTPDGWAKGLRKRAATAKLKGVHAHTLRHTYASIALNAGVPPWKVKKVLGHKTDIMLDRYAHDLDPEATADEFPWLGE
jgi:integrase